MRECVGVGCISAPFDCDCSHPQIPQPPLPPLPQHCLLLHCTHLLLLQLSLSTFHHPIVTVNCHCQLSLLGSRLRVPPTSGPLPPTHQGENFAGGMEVFIFHSPSNSYLRCHFPCHFPCCHQTKNREHHPRNLATPLPANFVLSDRRKSLNTWKEGRMDALEMERTYFGTLNGRM